MNRREFIKHSSVVLSIGGVSVLPFSKSGKAVDNTVMGEYKGINFATTPKFESEYECVDEKMLNGFRQFFSVFGDEVTEESVNENLVGEDGYFGTYMENGMYIYTFHEACILYLVDSLCYDTGDFEKLDNGQEEFHQIARRGDRDVLEKFIPAMKGWVEDVVNANRRRKRISVSKDMVNEYHSHMSEAEVGGKRQIPNENPLVRY